MSGPFYPQRQEPMSDLSPTEGELHRDLLVSLWLRHIPEEDRSVVAASLDAWLTFRNERHKVLTRRLTLAFRHTLGSGPEAQSAYQRVDDFREWLVRCGVNSGNPFRLDGR